MTYWRLHYHLIWSTFDRQPMLTVEREKLLYGVLHGKAAELNLKLHAMAMSRITSISWFPSRPLSPSPTACAI
jgi:REP element-mobilizing transposase RayT